MLDIIWETLHQIVVKYSLFGAPLIEFEDLRKVQLFLWRISKKFLLPLVTSGDAHWATLDWLGTGWLRSAALKVKVYVKGKWTVNRYTVQCAALCLYSCSFSCCLAGWGLRNWKSDGPSCIRHFFTFVFFLSCGGFIDSIDAGCLVVIWQYAKFEKAEKLSNNYLRYLPLHYYICVSTFYTVHRIGR